MAPSLKETASKNPSQIGDPVSLKAETSSTTPTEGEEGSKTQPQSSAQAAAPSQPGKPGQPAKETGKKSLKEMAESNPTMLGDPVSLKAEKSDGKDPVDHDNGPSGKSKL